MQFNSTLFIGAFTLIYLLYFFTAKNVKARTWLLLLASLGFYFSLSKSGILILGLVAFSDYLIAKKIFKTQNEKRKQYLLYLAVFIDLGILLLFRHITDWFNLGDIPFWPMVIGVSFFIFRSLGYVLDVQREMIDEPENNFANYLLYVSFFPLILTGPIQPSRDFLPQVQQPFAPEKVNTGKAIFLLCTGIIKKYILSNYLAVNFVDRVFDNSHLFTGIENLMATVAQALVVYFDFSGYTDLMIGICLLLGIDIIDNFNFPYLSQNITEYWRRWHMSLSKWLNEYLYFPMSFALRSWKKAGTITAVFITFVASGFWHGTSFHYTFWGILNGVALSWDIASAGLRDKLKKWIPSLVYMIISVLLTFTFLSLSGVFFKAPTMVSGMEMLKHIFTKPDFTFFGQWFAHYPWVFSIIAGTLILQFVLQLIYADVVLFFEKLPAFLLSLILAATVFIAYQVSGMDSLPFIYLEF